MFRLPMLRALGALTGLFIFGACSDGAPPLGPELPHPSTSNSVTSVTEAPSRTGFEGFIYSCDGSPPEEVRVTDGGTLHVRGLSNENRWVTGNPLLDGVVTNVVDLNVELKNGAGHVHGTGTLAPDAVDGEWKLDFHIDPSGNAWVGARGSGHGTGELTGLSIQWSTTPDDSGTDGLEGCSESSFATVAGVITG